MGKIIVIVEDTPDLLQNIADFLRMEDFTIVPCVSGLDALKKLENVVPDLIITDLWMPELDGFELIERIKSIELLRTVPIAIFSAKPYLENNARSLSLGVDRYIKKPCTPEDLLNSIRDLL